MEPKPIVELHTYYGYPTDDQLLSKYLYVRKYLLFSVNSNVQSFFLRFRIQLRPLPPPPPPPGPLSIQCTRTI